MEKNYTDLLKRWIEEEKTKHLNTIYNSGEKKIEAINRQIVLQEVLQKILENEIANSSFVLESNVNHKGKANIMIKELAKPNDDIQGWLEIRQAFDNEFKNKHTTYPMVFEWLKEYYQVPVKIK